MKMLFALVLMTAAGLSLELSARPSDKSSWLIGTAHLGIDLASHARATATPRFSALVEETKIRIPSISIRDLRARMQRGDDPFYVVDVREDSEWAQGHIPKAAHLSKGVIERDIEKMIPNPDALIVLYCGSGSRAVLAADNLGKMGYSSVLNMEGGYRAWVAAGFPIAKD